MNYGSGNVVKTIVKTFNTKSTRHLLLISIYSQVVFGIGIALAIVGFVAIYIIMLAYRIRLTYNNNSRSRLHLLPPLFLLLLLSPSVLRYHKERLAEQVKTYYLPNPNTVTANSKPPGTIKTLLHIQQQQQMVRLILVL